MNIIDILFAKKLGGGSPFPPVIKRVTGNPIEFSDGADAPLVKCTTTIQGYQEGTGTPSPDNVRPIHAYTESTISVGGKNLFDYTTLKNYSIWIGNNLLNIGAVNTRLLGIFHIVPQTSYTVSWDKTKFKLASMCYVQFDTIQAGNYAYDEYASVENTNGVYTFTARNSPYVLLYFAPTNASQEVSASDLNSLQIELGTSATDYEPFTETSHTTTFSQSIYQGNADFVGGEVTSEWVKVKLKDLTWAYLASNKFFYAINGGKKAGLLNIISNVFKTEDVNWGGGVNESAICGNLSNATIYIQTALYDNVSDFVSWLTTLDAEAAFEINPTTSSVTPTNLPIKSLFGYNHIESSTGEMTIDYITDAYQNFVNTVESALPNTRKGGVKAFDIFKTLDNPSTDPEPDKDSDEGDKKEEVKEATEEKSENKR